MWASVSVWKKPGESIMFQWENQSEFDADVYQTFGAGYADILLPQYVLGYTNTLASSPWYWG